MITKTTEAYAKINLYLDVTGKRADGYHDVVTVMQTVSLSDTVTVTRQDTTDCERTITVTCSDPAIPTDRRNIVWKCAEAFFETYNIPSYRVQIDILKRIPSEAGLGGGSADGAAVLRLLAGLYDTDASVEALCTIGARIGADIPFCVRGGVCLCEGLGERLIPLDVPTVAHPILIAYPAGSGVSTAEAYRLVDAVTEPTPFSVDRLIRELTDGVCPTSLYNRFEAAVCPHRPRIAALLARLSECGARSVLMSGSGCAVYGIFDDAAVRDRAAALLEADDIRVYPCNPI